MLAYLRVRGLALLDDVAMELATGMNVLTGETGAGKSMIVGALSLLRGAKSRPETVREGADSAVVDAQFEPSPDLTIRLEALFEEHGLPPSELEALVVQRHVPRTGRGRSFVQGALTTQAVLGQLGEELIDICSQHEHHFLTHTTRHIDVLDAYAGLGEARAVYAALHRDVGQLREELEQLRRQAAESASRADYLRFQIEEIDRVSPNAGEYDALKRRLGLMRQAHRWVEFARDAEEVLYEGDDAIASRLSALRERARGSAEDSEHLAAIGEQLAIAQIACEEAARAASRFASELEHDPGELEGAEDRLHELESLRRKHQVDVDRLVERAEQMRGELDGLDHIDARLAGLQQKVGLAEHKARLAAGELHAARSKAAEGLAAAVEQELGALHLEAARLQVKIESLPHLGPRGSDHVEFLFSANAGEPLSPLRRVASGGELSRVLLAIKGVLATGDHVATYVFDEVDAGVGGAVAEAIGRRLKRAARDHQVLCITHLPQIAAFADRHYRVEKQARRGRTITTVTMLEGEERIEELARMLAGRKVSETARDHARALVEAATSGGRDSRLG